LHNLGIRSLRFLVFLSCLLNLSPAATGQTAGPEYYGDLKWRLIGPFRGGRAVAVAGVPGEPNRFYFGGVNGGIWETTNAGVTWQPIFDRQHIASIGAIAVAPSNPKTIYAGTGESDIRSDLSSGDGVYKSTDGGQTWTNIGLRDTRQISRIIVDPHDANIVYVAALGHAYGPNSERGVFKTVDGGAPWVKILDQGPEIGAADLAIASGNSQILFATMWRAHRPPWSVYGPLGGPGSGLYRSLDGGQSWSHLTGAGLPEGEWARSGVTVSPDGKRVYALIDAKKTVTTSGAGLYRSDDGGNTWALANSDPRLTSRSWYFSGITSDPQNPDVIYVPNVALYRSENAGKTISIVRGAPGGDDYHQLWVDPNDSARLILGTDQGTTISVDRGKTWSSWYNQPTAQLYHVITDDGFPYAVYGAQQDSGGMAVFSRTDHGQITARDWFSPGGSESGYIAPDPNDPNIIYLTGTYGSVNRYDRRTSFSQNITPWPAPTRNTEIYERKYRAPWTPVLVFSPFDHKTLYLGTQFVMKTTDGGIHWETISPDLTGVPTTTEAKDATTPVTNADAKLRGYGVVFTISASQLDGGLIWAGSDTGLIHLTRDGGKTWKDVTPKGLTDWSKISFIEASHFDPGEAYAAVDRHRLDDQQPYLYRTRDYGASWQLIADGIAAPSFLRAVRQDSQDKNLLFAATELGIYVSFDDGDHWQSLQLNLPATSVRDMVIHGDDLVIATHGRSFWILDDISALRQVKHAMEVNGPWLYSPATTVRVDNDQFSGTPLPPEEPTAENPPNGAIFDYFLKTSPEHVKLEIFDLNGKLVRGFSSDERSTGKRPAQAIAERWVPKPQTLDRRPGMHRFVWDLQWGSTAGTPEGQEDEGDGEPRGPRVIPGTYDVRLTIDGQVLTQPFKVLMDPRSTATNAELEAQFELGKKMFDEANRTRQTLAEINSVQAQLTAVSDKLNAQQTSIKGSIRKAQAELQKILTRSGARSGDDMGLEAASANIAAALHVVESGNRTVPSQANFVFTEADKAAKLRIAEWGQWKTTQLPELNGQLRKAKAAEISISEIERAVEYLMTH
jgi:photosystem II stability/assembly factor-like uncharacterized protein